MNVYVKMQRPSKPFLNSTKGLQGSILLPKRKFRGVIFLQLNEVFSGNGKTSKFFHQYLSTATICKDQGASSNQFSVQSSCSQQFFLKVLELNSNYVLVATQSLFAVSIICYFNSLRLTPKFVEKSSLSFSVLFRFPDIHFWG